jgi:molybdenum cofactor biosynthesis enzyme MoaA
VIRENEPGVPRYLSAEDIEAYAPYAEPPPPGGRRARLRERLEQSGCAGPGQIGGKRWPIGCVSLEVTQRCNLDCSLCYLSEHSEAVLDIPLEELFRRIDMIHAHYGDHTDIQVSGGEPTLRRPEDLVRIVRRIAEKGMRASLFTNGIRASRALLTLLSEAGLTDVAFHVDLTQKRQGYDSELALNALRQRYIERARGLPLAVFFNTTVFAGNFDEVPALVRFFRGHTDVVSLASFQLQADTGRGVLRGRESHITPDAVVARIQAGAGRALRFDTLMAGHPRCNRYGMAFEINGALYDFYDDPGFVVPLLERTAGVAFPRTDRRAAVRAALLAFLKAPALWRRGFRWLGRTLWRARHDLVAARGRVRKLSFVVHNFMDAGGLERERLDACVFMVASSEGPISMCLHNAKRDRYILRPLPVAEGRWEPLTGRVSRDPGARPVPLRYVKRQVIRT